MANIVFIKPIHGDLRYIAENLKQSTRKEIVGLTGPNILAELEHCFQTSEVAVECRIDNVPVAAFGIIRTNPFVPEGVVWFVTTEDTQKNKIYTAKQSKKVMQSWLHDWERLYNWVNEDNKQTIKWLIWMGATVYPPEPRGIATMKYCYFEFRKQVK